MASTNLTVESTNPYIKGSIIPMADNKFLLKRDKFVYKPTGVSDRTHLVKVGENIWDIAFRYYGNSKLWYVIMDANTTVLNPFDIDIGTELVIPDLEQIKVQV